MNKDSLKREECRDVGNPLSGVVSRLRAQRGDVTSEEVVMLTVHLAIGSQYCLNSSQLGCGGWPRAI